MAERHFTTFALGQDLFGLDILLVREINRSPAITPVEHAPDFVAGLMNLRGQIVTVIDLGARLGLGKRGLTRESRCIILKTASEMAGRSGDARLEAAAPAELLGFLVDAVDDMVAVEESRIDPTPANVGQVNEKYLAGVIKLETKLVGLLNQTEVLKIVN